MLHFRFIPVLLSVLLMLGLTGCDDGGGEDNSAPRTVVTFGDSITSDYNYPGTPPWPEILQAMRPEWTIINRAAGSERIATTRAKASRSITEDTDVAVVMIGTVNAIFGDTGSYSSDLAEIIRIGKARGAKVVVCTIPPVSGSRIGLASTVDRINGLIRDTVSAEGATLVNIFGELNGSPERFPDGLHPDLDGQRIIATAVKEKI